MRRILATQRMDSDQEPALGDPPERGAATSAALSVGVRPAGDAPATPEGDEQGDRLFLIAEELAQDSSMLPDEGSAFTPPLKGMVSDAEVRRQAEQLAGLDIDSYIEAVMTGANDPRRLSAPDVIRRLGRVEKEDSDGPFYTAVVALDFDEGERRVGFIAQDRAARSGEWMPAHHAKAAGSIEEFSNRSLPIVSLMDTPGAAGDETANKNNQSHSISRLIAEMSNTDVPNLGIVYGLGYSGGAIPLAASNLIMSVRDGVFSTIQPKGLASIARRLNLSWQQCAKQVGLSPFELKRQGNIDAVIDYVPGDDVTNLRLAIVSGIVHVEETTKRFVADNPYILDHYRRSLQRYLNPSERLRKVQASAALKLAKNPTEYLNVFGVAYRYLRYLRVRRRIKSTTIRAFGRLAEGDLPTGELAARADRERREVFLRWMQDPDKVVYDDAAQKAWKNYNEKKDDLPKERGRFAQFLFGERQKNYQDAKDSLVSTVGMHLYNRWKTDAAGNFRALRGFIEQASDARALLRLSDIADPRGLIEAIRADEVLGPVLRTRFSHEGMKLFSATAEPSEAFLREQLAAEINMAITGAPLGQDMVIAGELSPDARASLNGERSPIVANRVIVDDRLGALLGPAASADSAASLTDATMVDVVLREDLREAFVGECENLLLFDAVYDHVVANLDSIAQEAESTRALSQQSLEKLVDTALTETGAADDGDAERRGSRFFEWHRQLTKNPRAGKFLGDVEEWKKNAAPHVADTLFVVVTFFFERLVTAYLQAEADHGRYDGRIAPRRIGRRKDFWNRLLQAYRDLLIRNVLNQQKRARALPPSLFVNEFFEDFEEHDGELISADPHRFPGLKVSIEKALQQGTPPCGVVTGIGRFAAGDESVNVGAVISNTAFKAGAFDMASAEKVCKLLVVCARRRLPVVCFISSSGMQTMEGAGALFSMAAVNDRITRFVRDFDLPIIVFGFGDCTGGAQASFVTHPLAHTCYFSGASMPFAGQIVVPSHLPADSYLANYLSSVPGAMSALVEHPFLPELDSALRRADPGIPLPRETVREVFSRVLANTVVDTMPTVETPSDRVDETALERPVRKVLIHARGCTAAKLVRVARAQRVQVVLVQSDPDMESTAADMLGEHDTLVCIGGNTPDESYLNARSVMSIAEAEQVDALHPGIGFLSENARFAELVRSRGVNFIGPPVLSMETMGNKSNAIATAIANGVPVVPGSHGILTDGDRAAAAAAEIGYPVLIKAVHGGGGKGIAVVESAGDFHEAFLRVSMEAQAAFGSGDIYLERYVESLRHIEVQVLRDRGGHTQVLGLRDCSVQRDKQKVVEESASTALPAELARAARDHARTLADAVAYVGAGTVEFIYDLAAGEVYFMEMNTRLQVEHPVTERVTGVDIVAEQLRVAGGASVAELQFQENGHAIEARVNAERLAPGGDGALSFQPCPGQVRECEFPSEPGIEVVSAIAAGKVVSPYYDSMVAQVIAHDADRESAAAKLADYLDRVRIRGIATNIALVKRVLRDEVFLRGDYDTGYLPEFLGRVDQDALVAEIAAAAGDDEDAIGRQSIVIEDSDELRVLAPSTGIFYITPSPTEPPFARAGDVVETGDSLCQLEAFKIFTPLRLQDFNTPSETPLYDPAKRFEIVRINVAGGQQVNAGDLLFVVRPTE